MVVKVRNNHETHNNTNDENSTNNTSLRNEHIDVDAVVNHDAAMNHVNHNNNNNKINSNIKDEMLFYHLTDHSIRTALIEYKYSGQDLSLLYKYVLSPIASFAVMYCTPRTIAPNVITLTGLCFMIISYCIIWYHVPMVFSTTSQDIEVHDDEVTTTTTIPRYIFLCNAIAILLYQTLDNMDGKQARLIQASSPLGLFFDHGCDAVNSIFGSVNWMVSLSLSKYDTVQAFIMLIGPYALFYISTWEEYYTGQLIMPIMNGPNEGLLGAVVVSIISFLYGPSFWQTSSWWDVAIQNSTVVTTIIPTMRPFIEQQQPLRNCDILIIITAICMIQEIVIKTITIVRKYGIDALFNLIPFMTLSLSTIIVSYYNYDIWITMPRTSLHLSSVLFVEMTTDLMLKHMTKQKYAPLRMILLPLVLFTILIATNQWPDTYLSTSDFLLIYTTVSCTYVLIKSVILIHEMCYVLNIWCFTVGKRDASKRVDHGNKIHKVH